MFVCILSSWDEGEENSLSKFSRLVVDWLKLWMTLCLDLDTKGTFVYSGEEDEKKWRRTERVKENSFLQTNCFSFSLPSLFPFLSLCICVPEIFFKYFCYSEGWGEKTEEFQRKLGNRAHTFTWPEKEIQMWLQLNLISSAGITRYVRCHLLITGSKLQTPFLLPPHLCPSAPISHFFFFFFFANDVWW